MNESSFKLKTICSASKELKLQKILTTPNIDEIRLESVSKYGLLNKDYRERLWPLFVTPLPSKEKGFNNLLQLDSKGVVDKYKSQINIDLQRTLKRFPPGIDDEERSLIQVRALDLILKVLHSDSRLHYYQGYHDIAITILLIVDDKNAYRILKYITAEFLTDFMTPTMEPTTKLLAYLYPIIGCVDASFAQFLEQKAGLNPPLFALSHLITWFGHVLDDNVDALARIYEFIMGIGDPLIPLYLSACYALHYKPLIYKTIWLDPANDCNNEAISTNESAFEVVKDVFDIGPAIHKILSSNITSLKLTLTSASSGFGDYNDENKRNENDIFDINLEEWIEQAAQLYLSHSPHTLVAERDKYLERCEEREKHERLINQQYKANSIAARKKTNIYSQKFFKWLNYLWTLLLKNYKKPGFLITLLSISFAIISYIILNISVRHPQANISQPKNIINAHINLSNKTD